MENYQLTTNVPGRMHIGTNAKWTDHYVDAEEADNDELVNNYFERHAPQSTEHVQEPLIAPEWLTANEEADEGDEDYEELSTNGEYVESPLIAPDMEF